MSRAPAELVDDYDLVVIGAGAAGMTAAVVGAIDGLRVLLIEKSTHVGGTSSRSAGTLWIPGNVFMSADEAAKDRCEARTYLNALVGQNSSAEMRDAFLEHGPAMLSFLQQHTALRFKPCPRHADYHPELPGARPGGRPVEAALFDGRELGPAFEKLRPPIAEFMVWGGMMVSKADIDLLLQAGRRLAGSAHAARLCARYLRDRLTHRRGTRLTMGNALCASLLHECFKHGVALATSTEVRAIELVGKKAHRLELHHDDTIRFVTAQHGVVFAGGGFSGNLKARQENLPKPTPRNTAAFDGADGTSQALAQTLGAQLGPSCEHNAWWFPSSIVPRGNADGVFPHIIMDRAKPGLIAVDRDGKRFTNEGLSYHQFARAQYANDAIPCWLVCDSHFMRRYGLGAIRPRGVGLRRAIASGYVKRAQTLEILAQHIGANARGLVDSAQRMTRYAQTGIDEDFGKGSDSLSRQNGDPNFNGPNPCLGPVQTSPFFAVQIEPADLGTSRGLLTNSHAQLIDAQGSPLPGLYASGNDMQSVMGGQYPAPGVTLGPGMAFAFAAARDLSP